MSSIYMDQLAEQIQTIWEKENDVTNTNVNKTEIGKDSLMIGISSKALSLRNTNQIRIDVSCRRGLRGFLEFPIIMTHTNDQDCILVYVDLGVKKLPVDLISELDMSKDIREIALRVFNRTEEVKKQYHG